MCQTKSPDNSSILSSIWDMISRLAGSFSWAEMAVEMAVGCDCHLQSPRPWLIVPDEAWYWLKHVLHNVWLYIKASYFKMWFYDYSHEAANVTFVSQDSLNTFLSHQTQPGCTAYYRIGHSISKATQLSRVEGTTFRRRSLVASLSEEMTFQQKPVTKAQFQQMHHH